mmetsp:Transcript_7751/g.11697  ORF Transcript_7751/g.11697 Transcript_7751/m.11697 type:complete len:218 (-) Transcript_7751:294-947(-)
MNTMPSCSTEAMASFTTSPELTISSNATSSRMGNASEMGKIFCSVFLFFDRGMPFMTKSATWSMGFDGFSTGTLTLILYSSKSPSRSWFLKCSALRPLVVPVNSSSILFSVMILAPFLHFSFLAFLCMLMLISTKSLMIWSTSFPWNPTSVNFVASTLMNGDLVILAILRATSVLPQPVGPIIRMFFGMTSLLSSSESLCLLHLFLIAIATALFAIL